MVKNIVAVIGGMFILIGIFLFLTRGWESALIIETIAKNAVRGIEALQGRSIPQSGARVA